MNKNKKNGGFTLIELLAVIVILGLLMAIAIPSVTRYITQSRKKTLIKTMDSYTNAVINSVNNAEYGPISNGNNLYYVPIECITLEKGGTNPFGDWREAYVVVGYRSDLYSYDYYFTFYDSAGYGMKLTKMDEITQSSLENPTSITAETIKGQTINGRNVYVLDKNTCNSSSAALYTGGAEGGSDPEEGYMYYYLDPSSSSVVETATKSSWSSWARKKIDTGKVEFCTIFSGGEACTEVNMHYGGSQVKLQDKKAEFESKGATCVETNNGVDESFECYEPGYDGFSSHYSWWVNEEGIYMIYLGNNYCEMWYEVDDGKIYCN